MAYSRNTPLSGLSNDFLSDLGMSFLSSMGQIGHEMPPKFGWIYDKQGAL